MATVTFTSGIVSVTLRANNYPIANPWKPNQKKGVSVGGLVKVSKRGSAVQFLPLTFTRLTATPKTNMESFIQNTVDGYMGTFDFTDWETTVWTPVRFWEIGDFQLIFADAISGNQKWDWTCKLRLEIS